MSDRGPISLVAKNLVKYAWVTQISFGKKTKKTNVRLYPIYPDTDRNIAITSLNLSMHISTYTIESLIHNNSIYRSESRITDGNQTTREFLAAHGP